MPDDMPTTRGDMRIDAPHPLEAQADAAAAMLSALANPHRLMILCLLIEAELPVGVLAERVGLSQSALSQHLARMRHQGIVSARREGHSVRYAVADPAVREMIATLYRIYCADADEPSPDKAG
ncbi:MAG: metalloregulator ArsR/SmtB family transcription factor [Tabrizicola sp.]|uniref:ArsR/SmtB family transcription factor n=1 Tax=Tabrizicola sp. TaxID=2005166 RepID=UPI00273669CC|nr:metalloregulator ArsR/SmtB family transcription factor [Tabrizicola sp.]MDP3261721.1 metalloregulator ArsR/SmtB family transcription factor [Tabrizicola sp.]MDP3648209.1 metalloregulator ArsR/SmtB family transcription factor [Paracoccaceae bacterium]MDZ4069026.1 metalloregulator ArsR/SmtB family transcription factor [Tabrizicola sp.]